MNKYIVLEVDIYGAGEIYTYENSLEEARQTIEDLNSNPSQWVRYEIWERVDER